MGEVLFTSSATAKNGREGHVASSDGILDFELVNPLKEPNKKGTNPEQLFAAGYAACFDGALNGVASNQSYNITSQTTADVSFLKDEGDGGYKIEVTLKVEIKGVSPEIADELVQAAHQNCPYSKAIRNNVEVTLIPQAMD